MLLLITDRSLAIKAANLTTIHLAKLAEPRKAYTHPRQSPTAASLAMTASSIHGPEPSLWSAR